MVAVGPVVPTRKLCEIAAEIRRDWKPINYAAKSYLEALSQLDSIHDMFYQDDARSIVRYFLSNASAWRGDTSKRIKAELKGMVK